MESQLHIENMSLERMHDLETQLLVAKEALFKYHLEEEVNNPSLSSISSKNDYIGSFEKNTRGIGLKTDPQKPFYQVGLLFLHFPLFSFIFLLT